MFVKVTAGFCENQGVDWKRTMRHSLQFGHKIVSTRMKRRSVSSISEFQMNIIGSYICYAALTLIVRLVFAITERVDCSTSN